MTEETELPPDAEATTYADVQAQVDEHFGGDWEKFLKAVQNPAEVLHFVLTTEYDKDTEKFEAWAKEKDLPPDWIPRFYGALTPEGELKGPEKPS